MDIMLVKGLLIYDFWKNKWMFFVSWRVINILFVIFSMCVFFSCDLGFFIKMLGELNIDWENVLFIWGFIFINYKLDISKFFNDIMLLFFK